MGTRAEPETAERAATEGRPSCADRLAWWIATGGGSGRAPIAPGTVGSLVGVALFASSAFIERACGARGMVGIVVGVLLGIGLWASSRVCRQMERADPPEIVVDEIVGQCVALAIAVEAGEGWPRWSLVVVSFGLFRLFDIWKPYPIRRVESWASGLGIMADDVVAGVYAGLAVHAAAVIVRHLS